MNNQLVQCVFNGVVNNVNIDFVVSRFRSRELGEYAFMSNIRLIQKALTNQR